MSAHLPTPHRHIRNQQIRALVIAFGVGSLISVGLGAYGSLHEPTFFALNLAGFSSGIAAFPASLTRHHSSSTGGAAFNC